MKKKQKELWALFFTFLKIGAFTFGGGYAMLALLEDACVRQKGWLTREEFLDMTAIAESTPGPAAVNSATYIGYQAGGFLGTVAATFAVCLPSFVVIYAISLFLDAFLAFPLVQAAFRGIQACVVYLILSAGWKLLRGMEKSLFNRCLVWGTAGSMVVLSFLSVSFSSVYYILLCGCLGLLACGLKRWKQRKEKRA